ncbi:creatininase family protein [Steroidobacter cummioxidans]|uniref:creatininase family protein n=1 Tax=Steroidobacter cummioxidans TaxID=1803913 RepID=UPI00137A12CD|nr:creatininase family protein [Steroidobacter cummioxidans]
MHKVLKASLTAAFLATAALNPTLSSAARPAASSQLVEFELMTWPEVRDALAAGKTTALIYTGGVEQRGPQNANGGHNLMARGIVKAIAQKLGNAIAMPVLPLTPNNASAQLPGTIGLTPDLLEAVLERMTEQSIATGFKNVVLMGDHGGGQGEGDKNVYRRVATKLNDKYSAQGIHVFYCDEVYMPANTAFDKEVAAQGYPASLHGGLTDTSIMMYLDTDGTYVRKKLLKDAVGIPVGADGRPQATDDPKLKNGIVGDGRRSSAKLGKRAFDLKVEYAVKQIQGFIPPST